MKRARAVVFWLAIAAGFAWCLDAAMRRDAAWTWARAYADAHGCRYERGIPYRMVCP